jgi:ribonuclease D
MPDTTVEWIDSVETLTRLLEQLDAAPVIGLDTEFMRVHTFWPELALVQVQVGARTALIDPKANVDLRTLSARVRRADGCVVMHSASEDLVALAPLAPAGEPPLAGLFDTQIAAAFAGLGPGLGYQRLVAELLGVELEKGETRSDWLKRPLSAQQLVYAAADVDHLPALHAELEARLARRSMRAWFQEDCDRLCAGSGADDLQPHLAFAAMWRAPPEQQARLRRLLRWREALARRIDRPRSWIFDNAVAGSLIETPPADAGALGERLRGQRSFPRREVGALFDLLNAPLTADDLVLPPIPAPIRGDAAQRLNEARTRAAARASELDLPPALLCPRRLLEAWVREEQPPELAGWRGQALAGCLG